MTRELKEDKIYDLEKCLSEHLKELGSAKHKTITFDLKKCKFRTDGILPDDLKGLSLCSSMGDAGQNG